MRVLLDTHVLLWALVEPRRLDGETRARIENGDTEVLLAPPAFGRSPSRPDSAAVISRSIRPRLPEPRSILGLPNWRSAPMRPLLSAGYPCCTTIPSTAFSSRRRSSSPRLSTQPMSSSRLIRTWSNVSKRAKPNSCPRGES
jgi:hypothetical protein